MNRKGIYVEIPIHGSMDELWEKTQNPEFHERWDLRFTTIEYLQRNGDEPQRFLYRTRIGFGLKIDGQGESTGTRDSCGDRTSSLKFWSDDPKSLIRTGSGYWKYLPEKNVTATGRVSCIRFLTWYDYEARFGPLGKILDRIAFRPLIGWATAWSFDRLRLWIEEGVPPEASRDRTLIYALARGTAAFIWFYHGLVPKLLYHNDIEMDLLGRIGTSSQNLRAAVTLAGMIEVCLALLILLLWRQRWPLWLTATLMVIGIPVVAVTAPEYLSAAFNPVSLNTSLAVLALIALVAGRKLPTAARCARKPAKQL